LGVKKHQPKLTYQMFDNTETLSLSELQCTARGTLWTLKRLKTYL